MPNELRDEVLAYLRERELVTHVYLERSLPVRLYRGGDVMAVCYVVDRRHEQYAGNLDSVHAADVVAGSIGQSGPNEEYVFNTLDHLKALNIRDHWLEDVGRRLESQADKGSSPASTIIS